jgi:hypothetical protein
MGVLSSFDSNRRASQHDSAAGLAGFAVAAT